jgi:TPR repeat protein
MDSLWSSAYHYGQGKERDLARAYPLYARACASDLPGGCANLGKLYRDGLGVPRSPELAESTFAKGCDSATVRGRLEACALLAELVIDGDSTALTPESAHDGPC